MGRTFAQARGFTAATALMLACACFGGSPIELDENVLQTELTEQRALWEAQGLRDYDYIAQKTCFCPDVELQPVRIVVREGDIETITVLDTGEMLSEDRHAFYTIDELFAIIEHAIEQERDGMSFEYDAQYHYPVDIRFYDRQATEWELGPKTGGTPVHVHPHATESYEVIAGRLDVYVNDGEYFYRLDKVVNSGVVSSSGMTFKAILHLAILMTSYPGEIRSVRPPSAIMRVFAMLGRILGYERAQEKWIKDGRRPPDRA